MLGNVDAAAEPRNAAPLAYSAVPDSAKAAAPIAPAAPPAAAGRTAPVNPPAPARPAPTSAPRSGSSTAQTGQKRPLSISAIVGFVCSGLGFLLITVPFGLWLGYRGRRETTAGSREGRTFAAAAIYLGWAWVIFWILALIAYLWILL